MLTGLSPRQHGIVGNGWYYRDTAEIRFWQHSNSLIQGKKFYEGIETCRCFGGSTKRTCALERNPKPHYGCDGSKVFDILDHTDCDLPSKLGPFPFASFWGPRAGLASTEWIAKASAEVLRQQSTELNARLFATPRLRLPTFCGARSGTGSGARPRCSDRHRSGSTHRCRSHRRFEYGLVPVDQPIMINRVLREAGYLKVRSSPFESSYSLASHPPLLSSIISWPTSTFNSRIASMKFGSSCKPSRVSTRWWHPASWSSTIRGSGELIALAKPNAWFAYYYWLDDQQAPDFARTIDIHRKPGYDPVELFMTSPGVPPSAPSEETGVSVSHGCDPIGSELGSSSHGLRPLRRTVRSYHWPETPSDMRDFPDYIRTLRGAIS